MRFASQNNAVEHGVRAVLLHALQSCAVLLTTKAKTTTKTV
ncbi:hypothetical protein [Allorhizobium sonneratiae]|nr:hypothetical protein [Allorhizobium sonneratiae]